MSTLYDVLREQKIPDGVDPIIGLRAWVVERPYLLPRTHLKSTGVDYRWNLADPEPAVCLAVPGMAVLRGAHRAPAAECSCGFYAINHMNIEAAAGWIGPDKVVGLVAMWGKIIVHSRGYRVEFARPIALLSHHNTTLATGVASQVGLPVIGVTHMTSFPVAERLTLETLRDVLAVVR